MADNKTDIWVYAHWAGMPESKCIGILSAHQAKGKKAFSFEYDGAWIKSKEQMLLDPDIGWYSGPQFSKKEQNFGIFLDSMPDTVARVDPVRCGPVSAHPTTESAHELDPVARTSPERNDRVLGPAR